jgi:ABC-type transport system involved in multi-copper enzyme maturation permease subunit
MSENTGAMATRSPAEVLTWRDLFSSTWRLFHLSFRITFRRKIVFMTGGVLAYYALLYALSVYQPGEGLNARDALFVLVELPGVVLGIYLAMDLVAKERDRQTLETLFSTASSHYLIWIVRLLGVYVVLLVALLTMSTISYFFFAEFPFILGALNAFIPAFLFTNVTFFFSAYARGANTAGMLGVGVLLLVLMTNESFEGTNYYIFMNPFEMPTTGAEFLWFERVLLNRLGVFATGALMLFLALRRMERREKFLG